MKVRTKTYCCGYKIGRTEVGIEEYLFEQTKTVPRLIRLDFPRSVMLIMGMVDGYRDRITMGGESSNFR
jgi:hypothetical protein